VLALPSRLTPEYLKLVDTIKSTPYIIQISKFIAIL